MKKSEKYTGTVTQKGQVTIPVEVRRLLSVGPSDKVAFVVEGEQVRLTRTTSVVERTAGAFKSAKPSRTVSELREEAERAIADEAVGRMRKRRQ